MNSKVRAIYFKELRDALRDRRVIFASIVIPMVVYPVMILILAEASQMARAKLEHEVFRVAVAPGTLALAEEIDKKSAAYHDPFADAEAKKKPAKPKLGISPEKSEPAPPRLSYEEMDSTVAEKALANGSVQAVLTLPDDFESALAAQKDAEISIHYDRAEHRSADACDRLHTIFDHYRSLVIHERLAAKDLKSEFLHPFKVEEKDVARAEKLGGSVFGALLPLMFIMMIIMGAMYPAVDMTAGEKERSTLETLVGAPVRPLEIITGKFLAVATLALSNATLNIASFAITFATVRIEGPHFQFPWSVLPVTLLLLVPLTLFFSALLLAVSCFASNTKEAQIICLPVFFLPVIGMAIVMMPGIELEGPFLVAPVVNIALMIKALFLGHGTTQQVIFVFVSTCLSAAAMVALAARVFAREEVLFSAQGSLRLFLSRRFFKANPTARAGDALLVAAILYPLNFYFSLWLSQFFPMDAITPAGFSMLVLLPQYLIFLALPIGIAWYLKVDRRRTFQWRRPPLRAVAGAILLGCGSWVIAQQLVAWQSYFWEYTAGDSNPLKKPIELISQTTSGKVLLIFLIGVTPAICEEHFFRGFVLQGLGRSRKWTAIILTSAIFALYHFPIFNQPVVGLIGIAIGYVAFESRSIWPGVCFHFLHNSLSTVGAGLLGLSEQEPIPGQPLPGVPLQFLVPAALSFIAGLVLVRGSGGGDAVALKEPHVLARNNETSTESTNPV